MLFSDSEDTAVFHGHKTLLTALSVSADGWTLASGTREGVVILWDIPSRQKIRTLELGAAVTNLQFVTAIKNMFIEDFTARQTIMTLGRAVVEPGIETCIQVRQTKDLPVPWAHHTDRHRTQVSSSGDSSTPCHMRSKINRLKVANEQLYRFALNCLSEKRKH